MNRGDEKRAESRQKRKDTESCKSVHEHNLSTVQYVKIWIMGRHDKCGKQKKHITGFKSYLLDVWFLLCKDTLKRF